MLSEVRCPFCNAKQTNPIKQWKYARAKVSRFHCECGQDFNFYKSKISNWTIPKAQKS